ncbi:MAG: biotin/lipoyl-binding protein, partial [Planctomycetota bacterium]
MRGILLIGLLLVLSACSVGDGDGSAAVLQHAAVRVQRVPEETGITALVAAEVLPLERRALAFPLAGRVTSLPVQVGQRVRAGAVLARMDDTAMRTELAAARADLAEAGQDVGRLHGLQADAALQEPDLGAAGRRLA